MTSNDKQFPCNEKSDRPCILSKTWEEETRQIFLSFILFYMWMSVLSFSIMALGHLEGLMFGRAMLSFRVIFLTSSPRLMQQSLKDQLNYRKDCITNCVLPTCQHGQRHSYSKKSNDRIPFSDSRFLTEAVKVIKMMSFASLLVFMKKRGSLFCPLQILYHHMHSMYQLNFLGTLSKYSLLLEIKWTV